MDPSSAPETLQTSDSRLIMKLLANRQPLMLLPDVAWPGRIPALAAEPQPEARANATAVRIRERTKLAATATVVRVDGPRRPALAVVPAGGVAVRPERRGRHAGVAAVEETHVEPVAPSGRHRKHVHGRHARGEARLLVAGVATSPDRELAISAGIAAPASISRVARR